MNAKRSLDERKRKGEGGVHSGTRKARPFKFVAARGLHNVFVNLDWRTTGPVVSEPNNQVVSIVSRTC